MYFDFVSNPRIFLADVDVYFDQGKVEAGWVWFSSGLQEIEKLEAEKISVSIKIPEVLRKARTAGNIKYPNEPVEFFIAK